ncbi:g9392 [Coccomyxa elongata]
MDRLTSHRCAGTSYAVTTLLVQQSTPRYITGSCRFARRYRSPQGPSILLHMLVRPHKIALRRGDVCVPNGTQPAGAFTAPSDPLVQKQVETAANIVTDLMEDVNRELFVASAVADITRESPEVTERDAIRAAVERRIESLDEFFVASLRLFGQAAREQKNDDVADRLDAIEEEVLQQVAGRLPSELRVLDLVQQLPSSEERVNLLKRAVSGAAADVSLPQCQLSSLQTIANQVIDDMEDKEVVPDRQLLARLCLIREELSVVATDEDGSSGGASDFEEAKVTHQRLIPQGTAAFVKEMLGVSSKEKRQALLRKTLDEGFQDSTKVKRPRGTEALRPGRLLTCLGGMQRELAAQRNASNEPVLKRLEELRLATLQLLTLTAYDS